MNILFLVMRYPEEKTASTLEKDLIKVFNENGHNCFVASIVERKYNKDSYILDDDGISVLKVKVGNFFNDASKIEKGLTVLKMPYQLRSNILKAFGTEKIDLIISYTNYMANGTLINSLTEHFHNKSLMMLWDIFPQNAVDLKMMKKSILYWFFKRREVSMLKRFDYIACNSEGNVQYLLDHYSFIDDDKLFLVRNCEYSRSTKKVNKTQIRKEFGFSPKDIVIVFGGNMGIPQKIENIIRIADHFKNKNEIKFLFIGQGTESSRFAKTAKENNNLTFLNFVPRKKYEEVLQSCDIGIISLNENFTVPNFPAKVTGYCKLGLPIFASLDPVAMNDLGHLIKKYEIGVVALAGSLSDGISKLNSIIDNSILRKRMSKNSRRFYEEELNITKSYTAIISKIEF